MKRVLILLMLVLAATGRSRAAGPVIFFTDLTSGPKTGGEGNNGVIVGIYGRNFGASQGASTVTVGGGSVATVKTWCSACSVGGNLDMIQAAIGASAATGTVVVTVNGVASTCENVDDGANCGFTVRAGNIYYISTTGSDSANGSFATPWATIKHSLGAVSPGDTVYLENGVSATTDDGTGFREAVGSANSGSAGNPVSYVAYPGATVTIGNYSNTPNYGWRNSGVYQNFVGMTFLSDSGLYLNASNQLGGTPGTFRVVNNNFHCYDPANQVQGCLTIAQSDYVWAFGNYFHDMLQNGQTSGDSGKEGHTLYFTTDTNHDWAGWNVMNNNNTCYEIQAHSSPLQTGTGNDQYDIHIHDNFISNDTCAGINLATVDPSQGTVEVYNNVLWNLGLEGTPPYSDFASFDTTCIYAAGILNNGSAGSGTVQIYNNTMYNCGNASVTYPTKAGIITVAGNAPNVFYNLSNNILYQTNSIGYLGADTGQVTCTNGKTDFFGSGAVPSGCSTGNLNADPLFVSTSTPSFVLQSASTMIGAGTTSHVSTYDVLGIVQPNPPTVGAYSGSNSISAIGTSATGATFSGATIR